MVAVEAERLMTKGSDLRYARRRRAMGRARDLARSGEHADHRSIISHLASSEDPALVQEWLEDRAFCAQLDKLCAMAQERCSA
jgi:hypothetical protein